VGAGQAEVDIARLAHTTIVVEAPGLGDDIQAIKAGILEIADILVVNKADRPGVENTVSALQNMLQLAQPTRRIFHQYGYEDESPSDIQTDNSSIWEPPVQRTVATDGNGVGDLVDLISKHRLHLEQSGDFHLRERNRLAGELHLRLQVSLVSEWQESLPRGLYNEVLDRLVARKISPQQAVEHLIAKKV
jgi:LAO/AO transport system kinase